MLRNALLASVAVFAATSAFAADLPSRKSAPAVPYVAAPVFTWTGFYVGADVGGGWTNDKIKSYTTATGAPIGTATLNGSGVLGGLFAGYNWQTGSNIVLGLEGDLEATSIAAKKSFAYTYGTTAVVIGTAPAKESIPYQGSIRARLGYAAGNVLFYATGGLAFAQFNTKYIDVLSPSSFSSVKGGWTLGAGVEYAFNNNWTARAEYRYTQFQNFTDNVNTGNTGNPGNFWSGTSVKHSVNESAVRVGIAYKFGAPASAVVAKY